MVQERHENYDYRKLRGRIKEIYGTQERFGKAMGLSEPGLSQRLNNITKFTQDEIYNACVLLSISTEDLCAYFFTRKVQKI